MGAAVISEVVISDVMRLTRTSEFDPWRATSMSSELRPGGPLQSSDNVYSFVMKNAEHGDDAFTPRALANLNMKVNPEVVKVQEQAVEIMKKWVGQYLVGKESK
jgi:hypothetical protein